jgi:hypothetical protein
VTAPRSTLTRLGGLATQVAEVCSEHIKITDNAIISMKERVVDKKDDPLVWLGSKIGLRRD